MSSSRRGRVGCVEENSEYGSQDDKDQCRAHLCISLVRDVIELLTVLIVVAESQDVHLKTMLVVHHRFGLYGVQSSLFLSIASKIHLTMNPSLRTGQEVLLKVPSTKLFTAKILKGEMRKCISGQALYCQYRLLVEKDIDLPLYRSSGETASDTGSEDRG
jgi:hypothetical protein